MSLEDSQTKKSMPESIFWRQTNTEILTHFNQTLKGYSKPQVEKLQEVHGANELKEEEGESIFDKIKEQIEDMLVRILLGAAVVSFILAMTSGHEEGISAFIEPLVILLILIANATIGVWQDINADKAIDALKKLQATSTTVIRDGNLNIIDARELVPGDIIHLKEGEKIPADVRMLEIETSNFMVNQSNFTGETRHAYKTAEPINKDELDLAQIFNIGFSSTSVIYGSATAIVIQTGMNTQIGKLTCMVKKAEEEETKSPLKQKLDEFGNWLTYIIGAICLIVWMMNFRNFFDDIHGSFLNGCIYYFKIAVALAVAAIPEGLPAVITTCLALGSRRMSECNAIVRKLDSIETLGCTTVICSDKTGTLTTNNMTVSKVMYFQNDTKSAVVRNVTGVSFEPIGTVEGLSSNEYKSSPNLGQFVNCLSVCNTSTILCEDNNYSIAGTATEGAMRVFVEKLKQIDSDFKGGVSSPMEYNNLIGRDFEVIYTLEFDRDRKSMSILAKDLKRNKYVLLIKGAAEILLRKANRYLNSEGRVSDLNEGDRTAINEQIVENFMKKSLRTLAICIKEDLPELNGYQMNKEDLKRYFKDLNNFALIENNCTLLGFVGMLDPPRPEVKEAIETCKKAGIRVIMITGDNKVTADSVGREIGILEEESIQSQSWIASEFFRLKEEEQIRLLKTQYSLIFSRSEPKHKMDLVTILKRQLVRFFL